jgi:hypothetical protein
MTVNLSATELAAIENGQAVPVKAAGLNVECVLVRTDIYQRVFGMASTSDEIEKMYPLLAETSPEDWEDAAVYGLDRSRP